jgi:ribonuclease T1
VRVLRRVRWPLLALVVLVIALIVGYGITALRDPGTGRSAPTPAARAAASSTTRPPAGSQVPLSSLPAQAAATVALIQRGGPFPYRQDGVVFDNAERHLPSRPRGYYHEYTVTTPGSADRGARRIITGSDGEYYYTADHYDSFVRVDVTR